MNMVGTESRPQLLWFMLYDDDALHHVSAVSLLMATLHVLWALRSSEINLKIATKMKYKQRSRWQWKLKDWQLTVSGFAIWDGWRLLWSVLLVFTASDQLRGLTSWSNKWVFQDTPYLISIAPRFSSFMSTLSKIKSVYISSSCCCCHLSLFPCTWISSFPRLQAWQPQARQPWPTDNRFPAKVCPSIPTYQRRAML